MGEDRQIEQLVRRRDVLKPIESARVARFVRLPDRLLRSKHRGFSPENRKPGVGFDDSVRNVADHNSTDATIPASGRGRCGSCDTSDNCHPPSAEYGTWHTGRAASTAGRCSARQTDCLRCPKQREPSQSPVPTTTYRTPTADGSDDNFRKSSSRAGEVDARTSRTGILNPTAKRG